jgi:3',5'-cyclic AMP phosphodiesterase CpdA
LRTLPALALFRPLWAAQEGAAFADAELTKDLLSTPGPTFRIGDATIEKNWILIAYGDMRFTDPANEKVANPKVRRWLVDRIATEHPDILLLSGDVPYDGSVVNDYEVYYQETHAWREEKLHVYPAMGNHELHGDEIRQPKNWWHAFPELKGRRWYSVEMPNAYIISLDSNLSLLDGSRQQLWLVDQLSHLPAKTQFVFFSLHHPPVADPLENSHSHDVRPNEHALALLLEKQAAASKAKFIVIAGHIHNYQRFLENGVMYLVSGGGGARPYPVARTAADLYQDANFPNFHYVKFSCDQKGLAAVMYRVQDPDAANPAWEIKDRFAM